MIYVLICTLLVGVLFFRARAFGAAIGVTWICLSIILEVCASKVVIACYRIRQNPHREWAPWLAFSCAAIVFGIVGVIGPLRILVAVAHLRNMVELLK